MNGQELEELTRAVTKAINNWGFIKDGYFPDTKHPETHGRVIELEFEFHDDGSKLKVTLDGIP